MADIESAENGEEETGATDDIEYDAEQEADYEASDLLRFLLKKIRATKVGKEDAVFQFTLTNDEIDWLGAWSVENEKMEPEEEEAEEQSAADEEHRAAI
jgi:hypothetical protein